MRFIVVCLSLLFSVLTPPSAEANEWRVFTCNGKTETSNFTYKLLRASPVSRTCTGDLIIHEGVVEIERYAFNGSGITTLTLPDSLVNTGEGVFSGTPLKSINLGKGLQTIGPESFNRTQITSVSIPDSVTRIEDDAFLDTPLLDVKIGKSVKFIGESAFRNTRISMIQLPDSVETLWPSAFHNTFLKTVLGGKGLIEIDGYVFENTELSSIVLSTKLKSIGRRAFAGTKLTSIKVPEGVTSIEDEAFADIPTLTKVSLPTKLSTIGKDVFDSNAKLTIEYCGKLSGFPVVPVCSLATKDTEKTKSIVCSKGKQELTVTGKNPKCPKGYKRK